MSAIDFKQLLLEERRKARNRMASEVVVPPLPGASPASSTDIGGSPSNLVSISYDESKIRFEKLSLCSLEHYQCNTTMPSMYYIPEVMNEDTEQELIDCVEKEGSERNMWQVLKTRKLQLHGKVPSSSDVKDSSSVDSELPPWLRHIADVLCECQVFPNDIYPNNVLINKYEKDQGIMHHTDGPSYFSYVVIFSLLSDCIMTFKPKLTPAEIGIKSDTDLLSVVLKRRSVLIFKDNLYEECMHGIYPEDIHIVGEHALCANSKEARVIDGQKVWIVCCMTSMAPGIFLIMIQISQHLMSQ